MSLVETVEALHLEDFSPAALMEIKMLKTFNCGVGFCLILNKKNKKKVLKYFSNEYKPYEIGYVSKSKKKLIFSGKLKW